MYLSMQMSQFTERPWLVFFRVQWPQEIIATIWSRLLQQRKLNVVLWQAMQNSVTYMRQSRILHQANNTHTHIHTQTCNRGKSNALGGKICNKTDYLQFRLDELKNDSSKSAIPRFISMFRDKRRIIRDLLHGRSNNVVTYETTYVPHCLVARKSCSCKDNSATLYDKYE
jgi:hypothetical protein